MVVGTIVAQGMVLVAMPVLTRLYPPEAIAVGALFLSISSTAATVATLRLDLAIVLPDDVLDAQALQRLVYLQVLIMVVPAGLVLLVAAPWVAGVVGPDSAGWGWVWLLLPMVTAIALTQTGVGMATRRGAFGGIVLANVVNAVFFVGTALAFGLWRPRLTSIVDARLVGQLACLSVLVLLGCLVWRGASLARPLEARRLWSEQRQFIVFNTPYSLVGSISRDLPLFAFAALGEPYLVASYALARTVMTAPATLAAAGLGSVFFRVAARSFGTPGLERLAGTLSTWGLALPLGGFALAVVWAGDIFDLVFGPDWATAGLFAAILSIPMWLSLQTGWPERLYEVARRQRVSFTIQVVFDVTQILGLSLAAVLSGDPKVVVGVFAVVNSAYHVVYLAGVYRVAGFALPPLLRSLAANATAFALAALALLALRPMGSTGLWLSIALAIVVTLVAAVRLIVTRPLDRSPVQSQELT